MREPGLKQTVAIKLRGRKAELKGRVKLTGTRLQYTRPNGRAPKLVLTYRQLFSLLESELEFPKIGKMQHRALVRPLKHGDFRLEVLERDDLGDYYSVLSSTSSLAKLDPRRVDLGVYQFSQDMASSTPRKKYQWFAQVSVPVAVWIVNRYVEKFLMQRKMTAHTDRDVVISKKQMREVLLALLFKLSR